MNQTKSLERFHGCLLGLAVGDAVGTTVEFKPRGTFPPVTDMIGRGPFALNPGEWTDDTSMAPCLATSLLEKNGFEAQDQMERYWNWYQTGYLSSNGRCFDIGDTVRAPGERYRQTGNPYSGSTQPSTAGNGSIMRLAPIPMFYFPNQDKILHFSGESSRTTHGAAEGVDACRLLGKILYRALGGANKEDLLSGTDPSLFRSEAVKEIAGGGYRQKQISAIRGTGYVIQSLEAALWCFWTTPSFEEAILKAANLGEDADTTAAVCGQVAGAFYGITGIPARWLNRLAMRQEIETLADQLFKK
jgi:ADP-ribosyl-[dinitrogen reductase] hydrolase